MGNILPIFLFLSIFCVIVLQGCGTLPNGRRWGQDVTLMPGWHRIKVSAVNAALSPETWGPVAGALTLQIDDMDKRISEWASENNPIFGSQKNASNWSDYLDTASGAFYFTTVMATPSGDDPSDWLKSKAKGLGIGIVASEITGGSTSLIKGLTKRTRPNGSNTRSMPSGHASGSAVFATLSRRNLDSIPLSQRKRITGTIAAVSLAAGTGWSRVEAKAHHPSDVLVGYALGHFLSTFLNDAFIGLDERNAPQLTLEPLRKGIWVGMSCPF